MKGVYDGGVAGVALRPSGLIIFRSTVLRAHTPMKMIWKRIRHIYIQYRMDLRSERIRDLMFKIHAPLISSVGFELHVLIWIANNIIKWSQLRNKLEAKFPSTVNTPRTAIKDAPFINVLHRASEEAASQL